MLDPLLDGMHAGIKHFGKAPAGSEVRIDFDREMSGLKKALNDAVETEDFEKAAELRDRIKDLEKELKAAEKVS